MAKYRGFGWGMDGWGNRHMTLDGRNVLFTVKKGENMFDAIDGYMSSKEEEFESKNGRQRRNTTDRKQEGQTSQNLAHVLGA